MLLNFRHFIHGRFLDTMSIILDNLDVFMQVYCGHTFVECLLRVIVSDGDCQGSMFVDTMFQGSNVELGFGEIILCFLELVDSADENRIVKAKIFSDDCTQLIGTCSKCNVSNKGFEIPIGLVVTY